MPAPASRPPKRHKGNSWPLHNLGDDPDERSAEEIAADEGIPASIVDLARKRLKDGRKHCKRFMKFVHQYGKQKQYCGDLESFPCEESHRREIILLRNIEQIETHNAHRKKGGMKKIVREVCRSSSRGIRLCARHVCRWQHAQGSPGQNSGGEEVGERQDWKEDAREAGGEGEG